MIIRLKKQINLQVVITNLTKTEMTTVQREQFQMKNVLFMLVHESDLLQLVDKELLLLDLVVPK
jgi:hypothetical protein